MNKFIKDVFTTPFLVYDGNGRVCTYRAIKLRNIDIEVSVAPGATGSSIVPTAFDIAGPFHRIFEMVTIFY